MKLWYSPIYVIIWEENMNYRIRIIFIFLIILLISGCSGQTIVYPDEYVPGQDQQYWYDSDGDLPMMDTEDGYYFMNGQFLYFRDKNSGETAPVCNKPECLHHDGTCNAYLPDTRSLIYNSGKIYFLRDIYAESVTDTLFEMSVDGSKQKELISFPEYVYQFAIHRGYVYYITTDFGTISGKESETQTKMHFYRVPLAKINANPELLFTLQGIYANIGALLCYRNYIYFSSGYIPDASLNQYECHMNRYSIRENILSVLPSYGAGQYTIFTDKLAFTSPDGTYLCDMNGQNVEKIWDRYGKLSSGSRYLLIDAVIDADVLDKKAPRTVSAFNNDGDFMGSIELDGFKPMPIGVVNDTYMVPYYDQDTNLMTIYSIPLDKIMDGTGTPEVFFEYTGQ